MHFDGSGAALAESESSANSNSRAAQHSSESEEDEAVDPTTSTPRHVTPNGPNQGGMLSILQYVLSLPFAVGGRAISGLYFILAKLFPFLPRLFGYQPANNTGTRSLPRADPRTTAINVIRKFEETYGKTGLKFFQGGFAQAFEQAKAQFKYLVVVLESEDEDLTGPFNRQVLTDERVVEFLSSEEIIVWLGNVETSEGSQVAQSLHCPSFPFTQLIAPYPRSQNSSTVVMKALASIVGQTDPQLYRSLLEDKVDAHRATRMSLVMDHQEREMERQLRDEQNAAYERSLAADREREKVAREDSIRKEQEAKVQQLEAEKAALEQERLEQEQQALRKERKKNERQWKLWRTGQLNLHLDSESTTEDTARVSIRLLSGHRLIHRFRGTQTLDDIYAFVECQDILTNSFITETPKGPPEGYVHEYSFELATTMPRKVLIPDTNTLIKDDTHVWPSASLVVEVEDAEDLSEED